MKELTFTQAGCLADLMGGGKGKDGRARLLITLATKHPYPVRMGEAANLLGTSVANMTILINALYKGGWVERSELDGDRRVVLVSVTAKTLKAIDKATNGGKQP